MYGFSCPRCFVALNPFGICPSCGWRPIPTAGLSDAGAAARRERALVAEADAARLDWLEARMKGEVAVWLCGAGNILLESGRPAGVKGPRANGDTLRAAIDAAMESEGKDKEEQP